MVRAGRLTRKQLVEVEPGIFLGIRAARAYRRAKVAFKNHGKTLKIVGKFAAYRTAHVQDGMRHAGLYGPRSQREYYNLNPDSQVVIAADPNGSHQKGTAIDVLVDGRSRLTEAERKLLKKFGWGWQFGNDDPNHFLHNGITAITPVTRAWCKKNHLFTQN